MPDVGRSVASLKWRIVPDDEPRGEPVPINCTTCCDTGTIPSDPIFVNTASHYGTEYRSEEPCPDCNLGRGKPGTVVWDERFPGHYVHVQFDDGHRSPCHPTWEMVYGERPVGAIGEHTPRGRNER